MSIYDIEVTTIDGRPETLARYRGRTLLIVNVASKCGFTPQYKGLEQLHRSYHDRGFDVLGFPCDQFGHQEPGDEAAIRDFCSLAYDVTFPMFAKVLVNGPNAHPVYQYLKAEKGGLLGSRSIKWNFTKFLVSPAGKVIKRYGSRDTPAAIEADIAELLG